MWAESVSISAADPLIVVSLIDFKFSTMLIFGPIISISTRFDIKSAAGGLTREWSLPEQARPCAINFLLCHF